MTYDADALMSMERVFKTRLQRRGVKQSGKIDIEFKIVNEYLVKVNKIKRRCCGGDDDDVWWFMTMMVAACGGGGEWRRVVMGIGTPRATWIPNPAEVIREKKRKGKQVARESSLPKPSLKIRIKRQKVTPITPLPPSDDRERDEIHEATQLSLASHKTDKAYEEQQNVAAVEQHMLNEHVVKLVEGEEEESDGTEFADTKYDKKNDDDVDDDNDDDDDDDHALIRTRERMEEMCESLRNEVTKLIISTTNDMMKESLPKMMIDPQLALTGMMLIASATMMTIKEMMLPLGGEKCEKVKDVKEFEDAWVDDPVTDKDEVILEDETLELINEFQNVDKRVPTIFDRERMEATLRDMRNSNEPPRYLYNKDLFFLKYGNTREKRFMDLEELSKFCDAMLEKVLKEVNMKIFETEFMKKTPLLGGLDLKIMKAYKREIMKRLTLDESFSSKTYVRKFLRALHPKWRPKVTAVEESKDFSSLPRDELVDNLKVYEVVMEKDSEIIKGKKDKYKSLALKAKKESSDDDSYTSVSKDEEYGMAVRDFKKCFKRIGRFVRQPRDKKKSIRKAQDDKKGKGERKCSWSDSGKEEVEFKKDDICLMDHESKELGLSEQLVRKVIVKVDQNDVSGSTTSVSSVGQDTTGPSDVHTSSANDVTKGPDLSENTKGPVSFAKLVTGKPSRKTANFHILDWLAGNGDDVAYPWSLVSMDCQINDEPVVENGPWFIRNTPLILKEWTPNVNLLKEDMGSVLVLESWGRSNFARAMIKLRVGVERYNHGASSKLVGEGFSRCTIRVEYKWKPHRCPTCKVFGHVLDDFLKVVDM
ncbi:hypothetical protein Tco_1256684 [Tanacetum coccineum]